MTPLHYPHRAGWKKRNTARSAARSADQRKHSLQHAIITALRAMGPMTTDECAARLGEGVLTVRPRFSELSKQQKVSDSGERRPNASGRTAIVWELNE